MVSSLLILCKIIKIYEFSPKNNKIRHVPMPLLDEMVEWAVANKMKLLFDIKAADKPASYYFTGSILGKFIINVFPDN